jgi:Domain of unknown function (DUF5916)
VDKLTCILAAILTLLLYNTSEAQTGLKGNERAITIQKTAGSIKLDGILTEPDWQNAAVAGAFTQNFPSDTALANSQTEARVCFDNDFLYVAAVCWQPNKYTVQTLKRDFPEGNTDNFYVSIDPFGDKLNGFHFAVNPDGVQREGQIFNGYTLNTDWDNVWESVVKKYGDRWVVEMAIPFKSLRYKVLDGANTWHVNFVRINITENERSSWVPVSRNQQLKDMTFTGDMHWATTTPKPGPSIAFLPYGLAEGSKNYIGNSTTPPGTVQRKLNAGIDAKIAVTPSLNLDLTVNPDFAQVDVDQQVTDLSRFQLFFPERRQFFVENGDLFGSFGAAYNEVRPFFSRRIGLSNENPNTGAVNKIPIIAGARLSGRINKDWRVGLLNTQTAADIDNDSLPAHNFLVAAVQRRVFKRSNIAALFVNKNAFFNKETGSNYNRYNRVGGLEFNYASESGVWGAKVFGHYAFQPKKPGDQSTAGLELAYVTNKWQISPALYYIGKNFNAETGFVPRLGIIQHPMFAGYYYYPKGRLGKAINIIALVEDYSITYDNFEKRITDWSNNIQWQLQFSNTAEMSGSIIRHDYTWLFSDFDPTNKYKPGFNLLRAGTAYQYVTHRIGLKTDTRKLLTLGASYTFGQYFNGKIQRVVANLAYRWQPYGVFSINSNYTRIRLPEGFNQADFWVVGAKSELTFTKKIFWTTFLQYNNQFNNININSRLQWRFKPLSDFFLVYTDNYFAEDESMRNAHRFGKKNKALVLKFNYWFRL